jgi:DsbC/DsbD-like thiol-disulfide interchange protein
MTSGIHRALCSSVARATSTRSVAVALLAMALAGISTTGSAEPDASIVQWNAELAPGQPVRAGARTTLLLSGEIPDGWHVYALTQPPGGPIALKVSLDDAETGRITGNIQAPAPLKKRDRALDLETQTYSGALQLAVPVSLRDGLPGGPHEIRVSVRYQSCSDRECRPPRVVHLSTSVDVEPGP